MLSASWLTGDRIGEALAPPARDVVDEHLVGLVPDKLRMLHRHAVPNYRLVEPPERFLLVHRWSPEGYVSILQADAGDIVRVEPFDAVELRVSALVGREDDEA